MTSARPADAAYSANAECVRHPPAALCVMTWTGSRPANGTTIAVAATTPDERYTLISTAGFAVASSSTTRFSLTSSKRS